MESTRQLTAMIEREGDAYVALCPELDIASQGQTVETARTSLIKALELFVESADPTEVARRLHSEVFVTRASRSRFGKLHVLSGREVCQILEGQGFSAVRPWQSHRDAAAIRQHHDDRSGPGPCRTHVWHAVQHHPAIRRGTEALRALVSRLAAQDTSDAYIGRGHYLETRCH